MWGKTWEEGLGIKSLCKTEDSSEVVYQSCSHEEIASYKPCLTSYDGDTLLDNLPNFWYELEIFFMVDCLLGVDCFVLQYFGG